jgi:hypothetical protein
MIPSSVLSAGFFPASSGGPVPTLQDEVLAELEEAKEALDAAQSLLAAATARAYEIVRKAQVDKGKQPVHGRSRLCKRPCMKGKSFA